MLFVVCINHGGRRRTVVVNVEAGVGKPKPSASAIGNERAHYTIPSADNAPYPDVILYRSGVHPFLYASVRTEPGQASWPTPVPTNISNDESNLNTGRLPDGRV